MKSVLITKNMVPRIVGRHGADGRGANGYGIASGSGLDAGEVESVDSDYDNDEDAFRDCWRPRTSAVKELQHSAVAP